MMTVTEANVLKLVEAKTRSNSMAVPSQPSSVTTRGDYPLRLEDVEDTLSSSQPSPHDMNLQRRRPSACGAADTNDRDARRNSSVTSSSLARRSQSCRISSSKNSMRPHVRRRMRGEAGLPPSGEGNYNNSNATVNNASSPSLREVLDEERHSKTQPATPNHQQFSVVIDPYEEFLAKVNSCSRLYDPEEYFSRAKDEAEALESLSPSQYPPQECLPLRRSASARRPSKHKLTPDTSSFDHSPTPPRQPRHSISRSRNSVSAYRSSTSRKNTSGLLEVRDSQGDNLDTTEQYLMRNFSTTHKGSIINRGDSFRRRRSRSNSVVPPPPAELPPTSPTSPRTLPNSPQHTANASGLDESEEYEAEKARPNSSYRVPLLGSLEVGKKSLIHQFRTSECINAFSSGDELEQSEEEIEAAVSISLNGYESEIVFVNVFSDDEIDSEAEQDVSGWVLVYSITDRSSFELASEQLDLLQERGLLKGKAVVLVANKCELERSRTVASDEGRDLACSFNGKFMEISVGMNHRCDDLLVGLMHQLRLKEETETTNKSTWPRHRTLVRASLKAKKLLNRVMGKSEAKNRQCEDFTN